MGATWTQLRPPAPAFTENDIPLLDGKVLIVTGGNAGIGLELVKMLYPKGSSTIYIASRSQIRIDAAIEHIKATVTAPRGTSSAQLKSIIVDFNDLTTVSQAVSNFLAQESRLDVLWNNAGVAQQPLKSTTVQGYEVHMGVNCLGPYLFTKLLTPIIVHSVKTAAPNSIRVIFTSSQIIDSMGPQGGVSLAEQEPGKWPDDKNHVYSASKVANWFMASELDKRIRKDGVVSITQNPGNLRTKAWNPAPWTMKIIMTPFMYQANYGAYTELWCGLSPSITTDDGESSLYRGEVDGIPVPERTSCPASRPKRTAEQVSRLSFGIGAMRRRANTLVDAASFVDFERGTHHPRALRQTEHDGAAREEVSEKVGIDAAARSAKGDVAAQRSVSFIMALGLWGFIIILIFSLRTAPSHRQNSSCVQKSRQHSLSMASPEPRLPIWVFDNPRTCSQLLHRFFKQHPQLEARTTHQWATHATIAGPERMQIRVQNRERARVADQRLQTELIAMLPSEMFDITKESYGVAAERLAGAIEAAQAKGKIPYVKEHIACILKPAILSNIFCDGNSTQLLNNPTFIPDHLFTDIRKPLFQIRHPARVIASFYRTQLVNFCNDPDEDAVRMWTMQRMTRWFFELLRDQGRDPILIDAEDVVFRSEALCRKLCDMWEIDPGGLVFSWTAVTPEKRGSHPLEHYCDTLDRSSSVIPPEQMTVDIDAEQAKWIKEFGQDVASTLRDIVNTDMPDYLYMQQYRLQLAD